MRALGFLLGATLLAPAATVAQTRPVTKADPYLWLEDKDGPKALAWVEAENARTLPLLQDDPRYATFYREAFAIASADDRIPYPDQLNGRVFNFWRDTAHPHGIWRYTSQADYLQASPEWTTVLDVDALGKAEGKNWVFEGATCLQPDENRCLVSLSEGGEDATTMREFDLTTGRFVDGGFVLPKSKQGAAWIDRDTLLVSRDWGAGTMTASGYPFVVKLVKRGQALVGAPEVYRGAPEDQVGTYAVTLSDAEGNRAVVIQRGQAFFGGDKLLWTPAGVRKLDMPARAVPQGMIAGRVIFKTSDPWGPVPAGAIASVPLASLERGDATPTPVFLPTPRQAIEDVATTKSTLIVDYLDNVRGRVAVLAPQSNGGWTTRSVALPDNVSVGIAGTTDRSDTAFLTVTGFLTPTSLLIMNGETTATPTRIKAFPAQFDASRDVVEQYEATSTDGTRVPYFVVHRKDIVPDGATPTLMTAYGGFEISRTPGYSGITGKLWLERGGSYVLANIRGGGEFGPAWHDAGRKTKRQVIYDDFAAVARDLFARRLTSPQKLGIYGGSNGGLLMGVEFNQHPDLWKAVAIQVPLLDMMRYEKIEAGASWVDEYGSVSVPAEKAFLETISPYQNLTKGRAYPEPYIWTTTKDDRVGPQHARKFAARMKEYGLPYLYYEDTAGGHTGDADIAQGARLQALQMTYFAQKLLGPVSAAK